MIIKTEDNEIILQKGKTNLKEIAQFFGISYETIRKQKAKEKYLNLLKDYANFEYSNRIFIITEVKIPYPYCKIKDIIKENLPKYWHKSGIDTATRVGTEIWYKESRVHSQIKKVTSQNYARVAKKELFGRNTIDEFGELGYCEYVWCKYEKNECILLNEDEEKAIKEAAEKAYGVYNDKQVKVIDAYQKKEITDDEFKEAMINIGLKMKNDAYADFVDLVIEKLGFMPEKCTKITYVQNFQ